MEYSYTFRKFRQGIFSFLFGWIAFWIGFSIAYDIVLLMNGIFVESLGIGIISGIISGLIVAYSTYKYIECIEFRKRHKKLLWKEILVHLQNLSRPTYSDFIIILSDIGKENTDEYKWTFQHLKDKHSDISTNFDLTKELTSDLNESLGELKKYIEEKESNAKLTNVISNIIESIFMKWINGLDDVEFKNKDGNDYIYTSPNDRHNEISSKQKQFLLRLFKNNKFRCKIENIENKCDLLNDTFDRFINKTKELIKRIENNDISELKGKCKECSFWKL